MRFPPIPLQMLQSVQWSTFRDRMTILRGEFGAEEPVMGNIPCRVSANRLYTDVPDPFDANIRSVAEWTVVTKPGYDLRGGDVCRIDRLPEDPRKILVFIIGEVVEGDTNEIATKFFGTRPKLAVPNFEVVLIRETNFDTGATTTLPAQTVRLVFRRVDPEAVPLRYLPAARSSYQPAVLIGDLSFDVRAGDRFSYVDPYSGHRYAGIVDDVLPLQSQRIEARCRIDVGGSR